MNMSKAKLPDYEYILNLSRENHAAMVAQGFWDNPTTFRTKLALVRGELYEAIEAYRRGPRRATMLVPIESSKEQFVAAYKANIVGTIEEEIADTVIRLSDTYGAFLPDAPQKSSSFNWLTSEYKEPFAHLMGEPLEGTTSEEVFDNIYSEERMKVFRLWAGEQNATFIDVVDRVVEEMFNAMYWDFESMKLMVVECIVLVCQLAYAYDIDLIAHIEMKRRYNTSRPYKHGKIV
jgi:NTP pyrophosphatase (non-canonical NTP hydrolase)